VMEAWEKISLAIQYYTPTNEDQYGPCRIGPAYPLVFRNDVQIPTVPYAHHGGNKICFPDYACDAAFKILYYGEMQIPMIQQRIPGEIRCTEIMRGLLEEGRKILESVSDQLTGYRLAENLRLINLIKFMEHTAVTVIHVKQWYLCNRKVRSEQDSEKLVKLLEEMIEIGRKEIENAQQTIPIVEADSRLGWEPSMEYIGDAAHIRWKIRQVTQVIEKELPLCIRGIYNGMR